jgi:hypothetical protein
MMEFARLAAAVSTTVTGNKRGRKKRPPPPTEQDRRAYHQRRLRNYRLSLLVAPAVVQAMLQVLIDQIELFS